MFTFRFRVQDATHREYVLIIHAWHYEEARDRAYRLCYQAGLCLIGR